MLKDVSFHFEYNNNDYDVVEEFYIPALSNAKFYDRAVGFFTLNSLVSVLVGINRFIENKGKIRIIASPKLTERDIEIINTSYELKNEVLTTAMLKEIEENSLTSSPEYKLFSKLLNEDIIEIKIASKQNLGMYHEKIGVISDGKNAMAFVGSMNETESGMKHNFESFDVYCDWKSDESHQRVIQKQKHFNKLWNNEFESLEVIDFPEAVKEKIVVSAGLAFNVKKTVETINVEDSLAPRAYQEEAINAWFENDCRGIFAMATGTGKTLTALFAMEKLNKRENGLLNIIVCPYQHLVEQWAEDIEKFGINPIKCYSKYPRWQTYLRAELRGLDCGAIKKSTIICTNTTFSGERMQNILKKAVCNINLIVDEVHNAGSRGMNNALSSIDYKYRLGLSATPKRHRDEEATEVLYKYFSGEVFQFGLEEAIDKDFLCEYYYYPINTYMDEQEYDEFKRLTTLIGKNMTTKKDGTLIPNSYAELLLIKRARIVAGIKDKLAKLSKVMTPYKEHNNLLVYCGATRIIENSGEYDEEDLEFGERQIIQVCRLLGNELDMNISKFTSDEDMNQREKIINDFSSKDCQAIVAIKCLDEGVNIPSIERAFILASTTNPKEYVQRRGRVLRKAKGKKFAYIYDFVCFPPSSVSKDENGILGLVKSELIRVREFSRLSKNVEENEVWISNVYDEYQIIMEDENE